MIDINKYNYEEYFIDFVDGKLSAVDKVLFTDFLNANPDLKSELKSFESITVQSENSLFKDKSSLKRNIIVDEFDKDNFGELCIAQIENDLNDNETKEFLNLIKRNPEREKEFKVYSLTKLSTDKNVVYDYKNDLKKSIKGRVVYLRYTSLSIAASIIILLCLYLFLPQNDLKIQSQAQTQNISQLSTKETKKAEKSENREIIKENKLNDINNTNTNSNSIINKVKKEENNQKIESYGMENSERDFTKMATILPYDFKIKENDLPKLKSIHLKKIEMEKSTDQTLEKSVNLKTFIAQTINSKVLNTERKNKIELFDIAQASINKINKITNSKMSLERKYDEKGNVKTTEFSSKLIAFSAPVKNN